ncbi:AMP-binding protein [Prescottella defluvii]|uniref:AMP-binding protein n=1 Tax=Prescottella defluvii TaxID=1323361 RepID=UPI0004F37274|nr:AMP-binding protein [Prescottella defluvii]
MRIVDEVASAGVLWRAGMVPRNPRAAAVGARAVARLGPFGGLAAFGAAVYPDRVAIVDERVRLTFDDFARRTHRLAHALRSRLPGPQPGIGILCRNHADAVVALCAASAAGARVVLLNSDFGRRQVSEVAARERLDAIIHDEEFASAVEGFDGPCWRAWCADPDAPDTLSALLANVPDTLPPRPARPASLVILTSGTSGTPKGAPRGEAPTLLLPAGLLSKIPLRGGERVLVAAPIFHGWGLLVATLTLTLGSTLVLRRRFDATKTLHDLQAHRCAALIAVPTMLRRLLGASDAEPSADLSALRIVASGGARLDTALVTQITDAWGSVLHNLYGSTEAAYISIATPADLAESPGCAGIPPRGNTVRIADDDGRPLPAGAEGRILVRTPGQIEAYTDGTRKSGTGGFLDTGDRGHLDTAGRLHVAGRSDAMIVSGGENVFPEEVETTLLAHPHVTDAVVTAVPDPDFGRRLRAYLVCTDDLDEQAVREYLAAELPRSRMPRDIVFVDALPRGSSGKVLRHTLDELKESHT